jgi:hypothetical protein
MITYRVLSVAVLLMLVYAVGVSCRSVETKNYYQISTTTDDEADHIREEELLILTNDEILSVHQMRRVEDEPQRATIKDKRKEKTRCVGPATLMAMCF